jgi:hypothetical protein
MDPVTGLAAAVVGVLAPFVARGAEKFAESAGAAAFETVQALLAFLRRRWSNDAEAADALARFQERPERYGPVLQDILSEQLRDDEGLRKQLSALLDSMGPTLTVVLEMQKAETATGLKAGQLASGTANVLMRIGKGRDVKGAEIDRIGVSPLRRAPRAASRSCSSATPCSATSVRRGSSVGLARGRHRDPAGRSRLPPRARHRRARLGQERPRRAAGRRPPGLAGLLHPQGPTLPLSEGSARSFLTRVGFQLSALHPDVFSSARSTSPWSSASAR